VAQNNEERQQAARAELARRELARREAIKQEQEAAGPQLFSQAAEAFLSNEPNRLSGLRGIGEVGLTLGTGLAAPLISGLGAAISAPEVGLDEAANVFNEGVDRFTFKPRTKIGQQLLGQITGPLEAIVSGVKDFAETGRFFNTGIAGTPASLPPALSAAAETVALGGPALAGLRVKAPPKLTSKQVIAAQALDDGIVIPQHSITGRGGILSGFADETKLNKAASAQNVPRFNELANQHLGRPPSAPLSIDDMKQYRRQQSQAYDNISNAGNIFLDGKFFNDIRNATKGIQRGDPALRKPGSFADEAIQLSKALKRDSQGRRILNMDASELQPNTQFLRELADEAFNQKLGKSSGPAYVKMAQAFEDVVARNLRNVDPEAVAAFQAARQNIAKSYTIQRALEGSNINIAKLRALARKDAPLTGELKQMAELSEKFPKATKLELEPPPKLTFIDQIVASGLLASGSPLLTAIGAATLGKPAIRGGLLSPTGQRLLQPSGSRPQLLPGLLASGALANEGLLDPRLVNEPVSQAIIAQQTGL
jgi:hypothetical protein